MARNNRIATINNAFGGGKFISITVNEDIKAGSQIMLQISESDSITDEIRSGGYIKNHHLYRRWVMAQMFRMLEWNPGWTDKHGYDGYLSCFGWKYQFRVLENEFNAMAHMEREHDPELAIRSSFWTDAVAIATMEDHITRMKKYGRSEGRFGTYKLNGRYVSMVEFETEKQRLLNIVNKFENAPSYRDKYYAIKMFSDNICKLPRNTPMCSVWKDAYKGAGAYYTLQNLIRFHGVGIRDDGKRRPGCYMVRSSMRYGNDAEKILEEKRAAYKGDGYKMFYFMKDVIEYNNFNFKARMKEIYR